MPLISSGVVLLACGACSTTGPISSEFAAPVHAYETATENGAYVAPAPISAKPTVWATTSESLQSTENAYDPNSATPMPRFSTERPLSQRRLYSAPILTEFAGIRERQSLQSEPREVRYLGAEWSLSAPSERTGLGFDVDVTPRVSYSRDGDFATRRVGGEVRIGQQFDRRGERHVIDGWSLFAGADGEALMWEPGAGGSMSVDRMALRDTVTVGDMQAGIAFQMGPGQISLSYIRREVEYSEKNLGASQNEEFAGITFSIRR
ncbi:MAG: hypothetical protein AAGJ84_08530 [Pseudomonadota bacterium]